MGATPSRADVAVAKVEIPQYRLLAILAVWAAAALPMAALAWLVAPALDDHLSGEGRVPLVKALLLLLTGGLIWLVYMVGQVLAKDLRAAVLRRLACFSLFWHALDIVWIGVMTLVYLMGAE